MPFLQIASTLYFTNQRPLQYKLALSAIEQASILSPVESVLFGDVGILGLVKWRVHFPEPLLKHAAEVTGDAHIDSATVVERGQHLCNKNNWSMALCNCIMMSSHLYTCIIRLVAHIMVE